MKRVDILEEERRKKGRNYYKSINWVVSHIVGLQGSYCRAEATATEPWDRSVSMLTVICAYSSDFPFALLDTPLSYSDMMEKEDREK